jgi:hypothetical protein
MHCGAYNLVIMTVHMQSLAILRSTKGKGEESIHDVPLLQGVARLVVLKGDANADPSAAVSRYEKVCDFALLFTETHF